MARDSYTAEQWLESATSGLNRLYTLFKEAGWQPDNSLLQGLAIATSQINEAAQLMRHAGPSGGDWRSMQTAPLNGVPILGVVGTKNRQVRIIQFGKTSHVPMYGWCLADQGVEDFDLCTPTAWMPLPELPPPASEGKS